MFLLPPPPMSPSSDASPSARPPRSFFHRIARWGRTQRIRHWLPAFLLFAIFGSEGNRTLAQSETNRSFTYFNDRRPQPLWSIHVVKFELGRPDLGFAVTLGGGQRIGLGTVSDQLKSLPASEGTPLAAINADFYTTEKQYEGDPRDVLIRNGELISAPDGHASFWIDPQGRFQSTNIVSRLRVRWPDGSTSPIGLNERRDPEAIVLYSAANGPSTRTRGGVEFILRRVEGQPWLPVRAGSTLDAFVFESAPDGNSTIPSGSLVLSLGPKVPERYRKLASGTRLQLLFDSFPSLSQVNLAIGGGPTLVRAGKAMTWSSIQLRHPRTAIGWNQTHGFLVEVDGRQSNLSVGMTFPELAAYMVSLGCTEALNLDGGGSATLWVRGQVVNSPSEGRERPGANALVLVRRHNTSTNAPAVGP